MTSSRRRLEHLSRAARPELTRRPQTQGFGLRPSLGTLRLPGSDITVEAVEAILGDPSSSVCVMRDGPKSSFTATSMVAELSVPPVVHLAPGPPASVPYETYTLGRLDNKFSRAD